MPIIQFEEKFNVLTHDIVVNEIVYLKLAITHRHPIKILHGMAIINLPNGF